MLRIYPEQVTKVRAEPGAKVARFTIRKPTKKALAEQYPKYTRQTVGRLSLTLAKCKPLGERSEQKVSRRAKQGGRNIKYNYDYLARKSILRTFRSNSYSVTWYKEIRLEREVLKLSSIVSHIEL